ncbi:hypothetical protein Ancab_014935, partial [Ancistrocladus abbreviatus]
LELKIEDIVLRSEVPSEVRELGQTLSILSALQKKQKISKKPKIDEMSNGQEDSTSASGGCDRHPVGLPAQHGPMW